MKRRDFFKTAIASGLACGLPGIKHGLAKPLPEAIVPDLGHRVLVFIKLAGGPDLRHLMPPPYDADPSSYGYQYWQAKAAAHGLDKNDPATWQQRWENDYTAFTSGETSLGILNQADWLQSMWNDGHVAVVNNMVGGVSRNHAHCQLIMDQGRIETTTTDVQRPGWGGRLAQFSNKKVISLTHTPRDFCFGADPGNPNKRTDEPLISIADSRNIALYHPTAGDELSGSGRIARSLQSYYAAKRNELPTNSHYRQFINHEAKAREFGDQISSHLASEQIPDAILNLYAGENRLNSPYFGKQIRNLRDSLVLSDLLDYNVVSMEYNGWDSHKSQKDSIEPKLHDLFGAGRGLDTLYQQLPESVSDQLIFVIAGEFGRQIKANGDNGCDHGKGNSMLVIGKQVNGVATDKTSRAHGDMFPLAELDRLSESSPDIDGLTEIDHLFGEICDAISPGAGNHVFPTRAARALEADVDLSGLFPPT